MKNYLTNCLSLCAGCLLLLSGGLRAMPADYQALLEQAAARHQLDGRILHAIAQDAHFNPEWVGADGRYGMMQLRMEQVAQQGRLRPSQVFEPAASIAYAAGYLDRLVQHYQGDPLRALQHYHSGKPVQQSFTLSWFGSQRAWANRIVKMALDGTDQPGSAWRCTTGPYLDDFADPNSRLNRFRAKEHSCQPGPACVQPSRACQSPY